MFLMYVDESGDVGKIKSPTKYFMLSAIVIHEMDWRKVLTSLATFRRMLKTNKGLRIKEEIHCTHLINSPGPLSRIPRNDRLDIIKKSIDWIEDQKELKVFSVVVDKSNCQGDVFEKAWNALIMHFENALLCRDFPSGPDIADKGIIITDNTDVVKLRTLVRRMRHYNQIHNNDAHDNGNRNIALQHVIEDPVFRDSSFSLMHQMNDVVAYCTRQLYEPNAYMKKKGAATFYNRLDQCLLTTVSSKGNGIVEL